jgi:hypothetical protein
LSKVDEKLIAYCGLYCGDCFGYKGKVADLARDLRKELRESKFDKFAAFISQEKFGKVYADYDKCYAVLGAMVRFRCKRGCRNGGDSPYCKIRKCCQKNGYDGCWECNDFTNCKKNEFLGAVHGDAHIKNLKRLKRKGKKEFIKGKHDWYSVVKSKNREP